MNSSRKAFTWRGWVFAEIHPRTFFFLAVFGILARGVLDGLGYSQAAAGVGLAALGCFALSFVSYVAELLTSLYSRSGFCTALLTLGFLGCLPFIGLKHANPVYVFLGMLLMSFGFLLGLAQIISSAILLKDSNATRSKL